MTFFFAVGKLRKKPGLLSDMSSLDLIGPIMPEIHNVVFSWRFIKL